MTQLEVTNLLGELFKTARIVSMSSKFHVWVEYAPHVDSITVRVREADCQDYSLAHLYSDYFYLDRDNSVEKLYACIREIESIVYQKQED